MNNKSVFLHERLYAYLWARKFYQTAKTIRDQLPREWPRLDRCSSAVSRGRMPGVQDWQNPTRFGRNGSREPASSALGEAFSQFHFTRRGRVARAISVALALSQNKVEEDFLRECVDLLPEGAEAVLLADRGFGRAALLKFLDTLS